MKCRVALPAVLVEEVEHRARVAGRPVDLEYGRLFALGLLGKLAEELAPLFPELKDRGRELSPPATGTKTAVTRAPSPGPIVAAFRAQEHEARDAVSTGRG